MTVPRWGLAAFLDESQSHRVLDPHTYLLAAAVCEPLAGDEVRDQLAALLLPHQVKLHWRDESDRRRRLLAATIAELPLRHLVVVREGRAGERAERRRRACLERMLYQLDRLYVTDATFESRGPADDQRDRDMVDTLRARRSISGRLRVHHLGGPVDPLLWVPDAICGAVSRDRVGDGRYLKIIEAKIPVAIISIGV